MLNIKDLYAYYGQIEALKGINLKVEAGKITCLIGSNGAGKTTLLKAISSMVKRTGSIIFNGKEEIINQSSRYIASKGITHVPEGRHIFPGLTVKENLEVGTINWHGFFGLKSYTKELSEVYDLFPRLKERENQLGWSLSGGEQQMLAIGRGIMARPSLLMLDEPSMGLAPIIIVELFEKIKAINKLGLPILLLEQNARVALSISDYAYIIEGGKVAFHGESKDLKDDPRIIKAYLGRFAGKESTG